MAETWLRIEVAADDDAPFVAMFEPTGMTYSIAGGEKMFADVTHLVKAEISIINWKGGVSIWAPGPVITRDANENELHRLN
jgi:hypothetical protein